MSKIETLSQAGGTYLLISKNSLHRQIKIGKHGMLTMQTGWYIYVGSAFGPGGLAARVGRHLRLNKLQRWHIDYLRSHVKVSEVWLSESQRRLEHEWASYFLSRDEFTVPQQGFGASDCQCAAHLFYCEQKPVWETFNRYFGEFDCKSFSVC